MNGDEIMPLKIVRNDINKMKADAIVDTADPAPGYGRGTDKAIYEAAGEKKLLEERRKIGAIERGKIAVTPAFGLDAKYIIHAVGPKWKGGDHGEEDIVTKCYENSLRAADERKCRSIAFPLLATGNYGYPKEEAFRIAISVISGFLEDHEMLIYLVVFDKESFELSGKLFRDVDAYIDDNYVDEAGATEGDINFVSARKNTAKLSCMEEPCLSYKPDGRSLDDVVDQLGETFQECLLREIDEREMTDVEVYKRANLSRQLFSKIRGHADYKPSKKTAAALAVALGLSLDETKDLLGRAGLAFSPSSRSDLIIEYFINNEVYDIYTINLALFEHGEQTLGV